MTPFKRFWISFWYNDVTRMIGVLGGLHLLPTLVLLAYLSVDGETIQTLLAIQYLAVFAWAMVDNDYNNLNKIGLDCYRKPLKKK